MKNLSAALVAALALGLSLTACSKTNAEDGPWVLDSFPGDPAPVAALEDVESTLSLDDGTVTGNGGVNTFNGTYTLTGDDISFSPLASTRMAGSPEAMEQEQLFFEALEKAAHIAMNDNTMMLSDADNTELMSLVPASRG